MSKATLDAIVKDENAKKAQKTKAKKFKFESDRPFLYIYPNIQFIDGKFETVDEKVAAHIRLFDVAREVK